MKNILLIVGVGAVVAGGAYFFLATPTATAPEVNEAVGVADDTADPAANTTIFGQGQGSLQAFINRDVSVQCTFTSTSEVGDAEGTFWADDDQFAVEALTRVDDTLYTTNMIQTADTTYIWSGTAEGMMAIKMDTSEFDTAPDADMPRPTQEYDLDQEVQYDCQPWTPDMLTFTPPATIDFVDMGMMMDGFFEGELRGMPEGMDFKLPENLQNI